MVFRSIVPYCLGSLSLQQTLELTNVYLENAYRSKDPYIALVLCHGAEVALSQAKSANKKYPADHNDDTVYQILREGMAAAYIDLGKYLEQRGYQREAIAICKKAEKWGGDAKDPGRLAQYSIPGSIANSSNGMGIVAAAVSLNIFPRNIRPPFIEMKLPDPDERLIDTPQLACCLGLLLHTTNSPTDTLVPRAHNWLQIVEKDTDEQERLHALATDVIKAFKRDELKDAKVISEVVQLAPVLTKDDFRDLLKDLLSEIERSASLDTPRVEGLARLIQGANSRYLDADDLVKILELLRTRLRDTQLQPSHHTRQLTLGISHVLDAMAEAQVKNVDRERIHEPLMEYLNSLKGSTDPFLVYQASYAYQALLCVSDEETLWQGALQSTGRVIEGLSGLVSSVRSVDLVNFIKGLEDIQKGLTGLSKSVRFASSAYIDGRELAKGGQESMESLKEGSGFEGKSVWYSALRGADTLIRRGELATFRKLVCEAPCRYNELFQLGVCQLLGEMALNPMWDTATRQSAIAFLGEIYRNDDMWGLHTTVKQLILNILMELISSNSISPPSSGPPGNTLQSHVTAAGKLLQDLEECDDTKKQNVYQECIRNGPINYPMGIPSPELASPSLLDRVQNRPAVENNLQMLKKERTRERGSVYVQPQAKEHMRDPDDKRFLLMDRVKEFLESERKVFLLHGESGSGKSTFCRELEFEMWQSYKKRAGRIPLYIYLPSIEKPEHDMIAKQLQKSEFTELQIQEMKHHRKFIVICDGYDESQQTQNLYVSNRLNQPGEWNAQMVVSCRTTYLGSDYKHLFQPGDRSTHSSLAMFQEVVMAPFSLDQVNAYIEQHVLTQQPLWSVEDYRRALEQVPLPAELSRSPFLVALSLGILPRMVDPGQRLSTTRMTRVALYDNFIDDWINRGKKNLDKRELSPQSKTALQSLADEGFRRTAINFMKKLVIAVFKEQRGQDTVQYSRFKDEGTWKAEFFGRDEEKQLLREAIPLSRNGNQYRFIHRSVLEYGLALVIFDPQDWKDKATSTFARRESTDSALSFQGVDVIKERMARSLEKDFGPGSPMSCKNLFVKEPSAVAFLKERVQQEPIFEQQLRSCIERSKTDVKWGTAAANATMILQQAGLQLNDTDMRGTLNPVQNGSDLEGRLRLLRIQRLKEREKTVYVEPQAKATLQASDDTRLPLMDKVKEFIDSDRRVFLLLGDSVSGKSTFVRQLESDLWQGYRKNTGKIPLHINLTDIDNPEQDMIAKQLLKSGFAEADISELHSREFILICDGYDDSQQTHNLYTGNRLNQEGEWIAQMIVTCRSEYLGVDYKDRFQPGDVVDRHSGSRKFQEAVITPFSEDQINDYIKQYISVHQPEWEASQYTRALEIIPGLKDLVKNPFLMALSLDILPRAMNPGDNLSTTQVTRVALYDQFIGNWLERGKRRLGGKELTSQAKAAFESLVEGECTRNGIDSMENVVEG